MYASAATALTYGATMQNPNPYEPARFAGVGRLRRSVLRPWLLAALGAVLLVAAAVDVVSAERWTFYTPYSTTIDDQYFVIASPFRSLVSIAFTAFGVFVLAAALVSWRNRRERG